LRIVEARRAKLASLLRECSYLPLEAICRQLGISEATARRDLQTLADRGTVRRTLGGAVADAEAPKFEDRLSAAQEAKRKIAARAVRLVPAGASLFLDGGTTLLQVAVALAKRHPPGLRVYTNNLPAAEVLVRHPSIEVHVLGGQFLPRHAQLCGERTLRSLDPLHFDLALMGGEAISQAGILGSHPAILELQHSVLSRSRDRAFCIDRTKLGSNARHLLVRWPDVRRLITDAPPRTLSEIAPEALPYLDKAV
jgi:DeoR/GlpR family transcriptional regulator of sugar metabolism